VALLLVEIAFWFFEHRRTAATTAKHEELLTQIASGLAENPAPEKRPHVLIKDIKLQFPERTEEPVVVKFTFVNVGNSDAVVKMWNKTLIYDVTLSSSRFPYQLNEALEFPVEAIEGTGNHAAMRFYGLTFTTETKKALDSKKARLFIFTRCEYRDDTGKVYPLPFARMYDPDLPGNLIFCPNHIVAE